MGTTIDADSGENLTLVERLVAGRWATVPSSNPGQDNGGGSILGSVTLAGAHDAWAVGTFDGPDARQTMILHYTD